MKSTKNKNRYSSGETVRSSSDSFTAVAAFCPDSFSILEGRECFCPLGDKQVAVRLQHLHTCIAIA